MHLLPLCDFLAFFNTIPAPMITINSMMSNTTRANEATMTALNVILSLLVSIGAVILSLGVAETLEERK